LPPNALCEGYTAAAREESKTYLTPKSSNAYGDLTPTEEPIVARFGSTVQGIVKKILSDWSAEMKKLLDRGKPLQNINQPMQVRMIMKHLDIFHEEWEASFGTMHIPEAHRDPQSLRSSEIHITTTGYGCKVLLGLMMADRIHVVEKKRQQLRAYICFKGVSMETLDEDSKERFVCKNQMCVEDEDGFMEFPIRLTFCCDKVIGMHCLKQWCNAKGKGLHDCPFCRSRFSDHFWDKLFGQTEASEILSRSIEMALMSNRGQSTQALRGTLDRGRLDPLSHAAHLARSPTSNESIPTLGVHSEPITHSTRLAASPTFNRDVEQTASSPDMDPHHPRHIDVGRWAETARSRRLNNRSARSQDNFETEG